MQFANRLSILLTGLFLTIAVVCQAKENELKSVTFGDRDTEYSFRNEQQKLIIDAVGRESASGLFVDHPELCLQSDRLSWSWRVDKIQPTADITVEEKEDFAAAVMVLFGKPGLFSKPKGLIYAFANTDLPKESVVNSPRAPDNFRTIVLENKDSSLMTWLEQERNIINDYQQAYGELPDKDLYTIGVFTDNDQTLEPVNASYSLQSCNLPTQISVNRLKEEDN